MPPRATYTLEELETLVGVSARTLRQWIRLKLVPKPIGKARSTRYDQRHVDRARAVQHLRTKRKSLRAIRTRFAALSERDIVALVPAPAAPDPMDAEGVPAPPPAPTYPATSWEVVQLMDGLVLMVNPALGSAIRRIADDIYRYYALPKQKV